MEKFLFKLIPFPNEKVRNTRIKPYKSIFKGLSNGLEIHYMSKRLFHCKSLELGVLPYTFKSD